MKKTRRLRQPELHKTVGAKLRTLRVLHGTTQAELAELLDVSFQQIQKYEKGTNRVSLEFLMKLSKFFKVSLTELLSIEPLIEDPNMDSLLAAMSNKEFKVLLTSWIKIKDKKVRDNVLSMVKNISETF